MTNFWSLKPHLVSKVWGGEKLKGLKSVKSLKGPLGESWEISRLIEGSTQVLQEGSDVALADIVTDDQLPYLIKFIDTTDNLSIQVHPDNAFAKQYENSKGKTECWLILDSLEGAGIYLGLRSGTTREELKEAIMAKKDLSKFLNFHPVKKGDFFNVPAGSTHAIGAGVTLAEMQQSSGITYRVWDWNRLGLDGKERELHIEKALKVIEFDSKKNTAEFFGSKKNLFSQMGRVELIRHCDFNVDLYNLETVNEIEISLLKSERLNSFVNLGGAAILLNDFLLNGYCSTVLDPKLESHKLNCQVSATKENECSNFLHIY